MNILFVDSTGDARIQNAPGAPAYFSRHLIEHLVAGGYGVVVATRFDATQAAAVDAVVTEWCNEDAFAAAASGVCRRLIVRVRGFDAHGPLDQLQWGNVDRLVYESEFLRELAQEKLGAGERGIQAYVLPSGIDLKRFRFKEREPRPVVALIARATSDKGLQLALEWARTRPGIMLHIALAFGEQNPRLVRYLEEAFVPNTTIHHNVDTAAWIDEIDASYVLSASIWETLGYSIVEGMAMGCKPLIHTAPGTKTNWGTGWQWETLADLDALFGGVSADGFQPAPGYDSRRYRRYVEEWFDAAELSAQFVELIEHVPERKRVVSASPPTSLALAGIEQALAANQLDTAASLLTDFRARTTARSYHHDERSGLALMLSAALAGAGRLDDAEVWALRSLTDGCRKDALCLLGETAAARGDIDDAIRWYVAADALEGTPSRYRALDLEEKAYDRRCGLIVQRSDENTAGAEPVLRVKRWLFVVTGRNVEKWITRCLDSIAGQIPFRDNAGMKCVIVDDDSTDDTEGVVRSYQSSVVTEIGSRFTLQRNSRRKWALRNIVETVRDYGQPGDVVVLVDGDDWLAGSTPKHNVLADLTANYHHGAWCTYGNFVTETGDPSWMPPYQRSVVTANTFRQVPWRGSHPLTFRYELFEKISEDAFKDPTGEWFKFSYDLALFLPMLEMAGHRASYIDTPLYVYNMGVAEPETAQVEEQTRVTALIRAKAPYKRLDKL